MFERIKTISKQFDEVTLRLSDAIDDIDHTSFNTTPHPAVYKNYPNPFKKQTTIYYNLPLNRKPVLKIGNLKGQQMAVIDVANMKSLVWTP